MDEWPSTPFVQDVQNLVGYFHHGIRDQSMRGRADALAYTLKRAAESGVSDEECRRLATEHFGLLMDATVPRQRPRTLWGRLSLRRNLIGRPRGQRELPPARP